MMLADLQRDFHRWLTTATQGDTLRDATRVATRAATDVAIGAAIGTANGVDAPVMAGLAVYQNNYRAQLMGCLELSYPRLRRWLGEDLFRKAAMLHIDTHLPHAWTLDAYADGFAQTLVELYPDNPDLQELAWIEHALGAAFVAADAAPLALDTLAEVDWDKARLTVAPSLRTAPATTNAEHVWAALWEEAEPPESEMLAEQGGFLVWRRAYTTYLKQVDVLEYDALLQLQADGSFAALCDWLAVRCGEAEGVAKAGELLASWFASELITDIQMA
jgi:hypothetical protein